MTTIMLLSAEEVARCCPPLDEDEAGFGALRTEQGNLPLKLLDVRARVTGLVAETRVRQTFVNTLRVPLEATYIFPLPDRSAVSRFRFEVGERVIEGELKERGEARRVYQEAIQSGHRAAITEEERPGVFTMRVGNLMPGEEATVHLTLNGPLPFSEGEATLRFPLVVAPRYIPGSPLPGASVGDGAALDTDAVPDASRISPPVLLPGFPNPVRLSLEVEVDASVQVRSLRSSLHAVVLEQTGGVKTVRLQPGERLDRDFVLRLGLAADAVQTELTLHEDEERPGEGTFQLVLLPPRHLPQEVRPRDVVFVLDRSGSMGGWKMIAARRACARLLDTLTDRDRFAVLAFDTTVERPDTLSQRGLIAASDRNRFRAVEYLAKVDARGGTEMADPLQQATDDLLAERGSGRERVLILITDGQVGNEDQILRTLGSRLQQLRVFTLGIDRAVNEGFLNRMAELGGGGCEIVESEHRLDEVMDSVHRRIGAPLLTELRLEGAGGLEVVAGSVTPPRLPDLFAGSPVRLAGRYRGRGGDLRVRARAGRGESWSEVVAGRRTSNAAITRVWARAQVRALEDRYAIEGGLDLHHEIVQLSLRHKVLCRFTSFVAVDRSEVVNEGGKLHKVTQAVEQPEGWASASDAFAAAPGMPMPRSAPMPSAFGGAMPPGSGAFQAFAAAEACFDDAGGDPFGAPSAPAGGGFGGADPFGAPSAPAGGGFGGADPFGGGFAPPPARAAAPAPRPSAAPPRAMAKRKAAPTKERKEEKPQEKGLLRSLWDKVGGKAASDTPTAPPADRAQARAGEGPGFRDELRALRDGLVATHAGLLAFLGDLRRLIERLEREGADVASLRTLRELRDRLTQALTAGATPQGDVDRLVQDARDTLRGLIEPNGTPVGRDQSFWF
ncbi:MAG: VIT domain-containing protein [Planctomycetota bacterium]